MASDDDDANRSAPQPALFEVLASGKGLAISWLLFEKQQFAESWTWT